MIALLPSYLGCLSTNPLVDGSVHDRSFFALAAHVTPVADSNAFSRRHMPRLERYAFRFDAPSIRAAIDALLADPAGALAATEVSWSALEQKFSMRQSARRIAAHVGLASLNARCAA
jgi:hypothetical protein